MGRVVNKRELAELLNISERTLTEWQGETLLPLPIEKRGERGQEHDYDVAAVFQWYADRALARAGKNKAALELELLELELKEKRRKDAVEERSLVPADEVKPAWTNLVIGAAAYMRSRASQLAGELEAAQGLEAKRAILRKSDTVFLTHLGGADGARIQAEVDALLEKQAAGETEAFLRRLAGNDLPPSAAGPALGGQS